MTILRRLVDGEDAARVAAGFDVGPGNVLMDAWCMKRTGEKFDKDGAWASGGRVHGGLLHVMMQEPYLKEKPPKSTGKEMFNMDWLQRKLDSLQENAPNDQDVQCTLAHFTAKCVIDAVKKFFSGTFEVSKDSCKLFELPWYYTCFLTIGSGLWWRSTQLFSARAHQALCRSRDEVQLGNCG